MHFYIIIIVIFTLLALFVFHGIWKRMRAYRLRSELGLKGPKVDFLFGNMKDMFDSKYKDQPLLILNDWRKQYGDVFGYYFGPKLTIVVADLDMIKEILIKKFDCFVDRELVALDFPNPICQGVTLLKGEKWKSIRASISPTLTISKMKQMADVMNDKIDSFMSKMRSYERLGETFDIYNDFQALTLDIIGQCALAMPVNCQMDKNDQLLLLAQELFHMLDVRNFPIWKLAYILPEMRPLFSKYRQYTRLHVLEQTLIRHLRKIVQGRKQRSKPNGERKTDILQFLLEQQADKDKELKRKWKLTDDVIVGNAVVFLLAGYEMSSIALGFTTWLLAKHKDVQTKLKNELKQKIADGSAAVDYEFVNKLPYMDAVFHESLRYFSVSQTVQRKCVKQCAIGSVRFTPGVEVQIFIPGIHHDPSIWPEPDKFYPERFLHNKTYDSISWLPFGAGPRNCIGMRFGEMEYKMVLARLLSEYTISFGPDSEDPLSLVENFFSLRPKNGVKVRLVKIGRDSNDSNQRSDVQNDN